MTQTEEKQTYHCDTCINVDEWNNCRVCGRHQPKLTPDNCLDCAMERQEYGAMYCPIHYMLMLDIGDSLYNYQDKTLYLITYITDKHITMENTQGNKITLENNATTLSNFKLIKSHD